MTSFTIMFVSFGGVWVYFAQGSCYPTFFAHNHLGQTQCKRYRKFNTFSTSGQLKQVGVATLLSGLSIVFMSGIYLSKMRPTLLGGDTIFLASSGGSCVTHTLLALWARIERMDSRGQSERHSPICTHLHQH